MHPFHWAWNRLTSFQRLRVLRKAAAAVQKKSETAIPRKKSFFMAWLPTHENLVAGT